MTTPISFWNFPVLAWPPLWGEEDADQRRKAASGGPVLLDSRASSMRSPTGATNTHLRAKSVPDSITLPPERFATSAEAKPKIAGHDAKIKMSSKSLDFPKKVSATHVRTSLVPVKSSEGILLPKTSRKPAKSTSPSRSSRKSSSTAANNRIAEGVHERLATKEAVSTRIPTAVSKEAHDAPDVIPDAHHSRDAPSSPAKAQKAGDKKKKKLKKGNSPDASCLPVLTIPAPAQDPRQVNTPRK
ncbi:hypothetical protein HPB51_023457 [Rhipicephalus microplus]|uniref:Uncharacterized protein n=1 Tax=Rhipicephalus microplus TaxID=6941 RepID=A0A9J6F8H3_RHIMP|nr:hypothetical protein HPB51_023457 [Rhipicephalus microplus]